MQADFAFGAPAAREVKGTLAPWERYALALSVPVPQEPGTCRRCPSWQRARHVCMGAGGLGPSVDPSQSGAPHGGLLAVGESPGRDEDERTGKPFTGPSGSYLREQVARWWRGDVAFTNAAKCASGEFIDEKAVLACRGFLREEVERIRPRRILAVGKWASLALTGTALPPLSTRRAYATVLGVPTFFVLHPAAALRNRHFRRAFERDLEHALTQEDPPHDPPGWEVLLDPEGADAYLRKLQELRLPVAFDCETSSADYLWRPEFRVLSVAISTNGRWGFVLPEAVLSHARVIESLRLLMEDPAVPKVGQNVKYDRHALRCAYGIEVRPLSEDTRAARRLLESDADADLDTMTWLVGLGGMKAESVELLRRSRRSIGHAFADLPEAVLWRRCAGDAVATWRLWRLFRGRLEGCPDLDATYRRLVMPSIEAFARIEEWGVPVSIPTAQALQAYLAARIERAHARVMAHPVVAEYEKGRGAFNAASPQQLAVLLYDVLGLPVPRETGNGHRSTDEAALRELAPREPWVASLLEARSLAKLKGTYADGLLEHVRPDGRIHTTFHPDGAASGRTSSSDPNLQNIPVRTEEGRMIRRCFAPPPGAVWMKADYSQLELRVAAEESGDRKMIQAFRDGRDFHRHAASIAFCVPYEAVTKEQRDAAKSFAVFGLLYKAGGYTDEEQRIADAVLGEFDALARWRQARMAEAEASGEVWSSWGGRPARRSRLWRAGDPQDRSAFGHAMNQALNRPIQGKASDYLVASAVEIVRWIQDEEVPAKLVLCVHDEVDLEVREEVVAQVAREVRRIMTSWPSKVPLTVDLEAGPSWGDLAHLEVA